MNKNLFKLISESNFSDLKVICEQKNTDSPKTYKIEGPYIYQGKKNANGRVYTPEMMRKSVSEFVENYIKTKRSVGELNHPQSAQINFENACHLVESLKEEDDYWIGTSKILTGTPKGDLLLGLVLNGVQTAVSTRGVGQLSDHNVVEDYKLIAIDIVSDPSGYGCFVNGILESKNFMVNAHGDIIEVAYNKLQNSLSTLPKHSIDRQKMITEALRTFLKTI